MGADREHYQWVPWHKTDTTRSGNASAADRKSARIIRKESAAVIERPTTDPYWGSVHLVLQQYHGVGCPRRIVSTHDGDDQFREPNGGTRLLFAQPVGVSMVIGLLTMVSCADPNS